VQMVIGTGVTNLMGFCTGMQMSIAICHRRIKMARNMSPSKSSSKQKKQSSSRSSTSKAGGGKAGPRKRKTIRGRKR
jgi:hypothetical protein